MIVFGTILAICIIYWILFAISRNEYTINSNYVKRKSKKMGVDGDYNKLTEEEKKTYDKIQKKADKLTDWMSWDIFTEDGFLTLNIVTTFAVLIVFIAATMIDMSYCAKKIKTCEVIEKQISEGRILYSQDVITELQLDVAKEKAFADTFPIITFYRRDLINKAYDKVMSLKIPKVEDTAQYILTINRDITLNTVETPE